MAKFGGADRIFISRESYNIYKIFCDEKRLFPQYRDLFYFAAALGIRLKKRVKCEKDVEIGKITNFDPDDVFEAILEELHPEEDGRKRLEILQEYAEAGIKILKEKYDSEGDIYLNEILDELM